jgi:methyl-accepting chemotaxis protein
VASAQEQNAGMDQIAQAIRDVSQTTNQFVDVSVRSRTAVESLEALSRELATMTERYRV